MLKKIKTKVMKKIRDMFSFEEGVDITNETNVLYRKNIVIKNIIFVTNILYTLILTLVTIGSPYGSNVVITIAFFPFTFLLNRTLKKLIYEDPKAMIRQQTAMYISSFYMFLISIFIYFKLKTGLEDYAQEAGYVLMYYSILVVALYQDKKLMRFIYPWIIVLVTIIHFTLTYPVYSNEYAHDAKDFVFSFFTSVEFKDIFLRTIVLIFYMVVVYFVVQIGSFMQNQRKTELSKRQTVEKDFRLVIGDLFDTVLDSSTGFLEDRQQAKLVGMMSKKIAGLLGINPKDCETIFQFATVAFNKEELSISKTFDKVVLTDNDYLEMKNKTNFGNRVIKRIQLSQKCERIVRTHLEGNATQTFISKNTLNQSDVASQIILLCELYVNLRSAKSYKRPSSHKMSVEMLNKEFRSYFSEDIFERFNKWEQDFEDMYNNM